MQNIVEVVESLSTPMLTFLISNEGHFQQLSKADENLIGLANDELANRGWPEKLTDEEIREAATYVPFGMPLHMIMCEATERGLSLDDDPIKWTVQISPQEADAIEAGAKFCEQHGLIPSMEDVCPECHHEELLADNPDLRDGEEAVRQAAMRG
jgi:hypothetical protein